MSALRTETDEELKHKSGTGRLQIEAGKLIFTDSISGGTGAKRM